jgi:hypothetical protein
MKHNLCSEWLAMRPSRYEYSPFNLILEMENAAEE